MTRYRAGLRTNVGLEDLVGRGAHEGVELDGPEVVAALGSTLTLLGDLLQAHVVRAHHLAEDGLGVLPRRRSCKEGKHHGPNLEGRNKSELRCLLGLNVFLKGEDR